ncbi:Penicillin acylase [Stylophora pistillata]|uniref:Penicillin acylase n=1 Tax=Stylophora pistillata TaxID=50429 RepID=A0A2B4RYU3_STYPI|nr:Penicillin acylase [Stylophora pistillata]
MTGLIAAGKDGGLDLLLMMKVLFMVFVIQCKFFVSNACTEFSLSSEDDSVVVGRSMEFIGALGYYLVVEPREYSHTSVPSKECFLHSSLHWQNKYIIAYVDVLDVLNDLDMPIATDGLNEVGLSLAANLFVGFAQFQKIPVEKCHMAVSSLQFPLWILGNFGTVQELRDALEKDSFPLVWEANVPEWLKGIFQLHYSIVDASGDAIVIEFTEQGRMVFNNTLGVVTNSPPYDFHLINIRNYVELSKSAHDALELGKVTFKPTGQGSGLLGIPGDFTPPSRFVRAAIMAHFSDPVKTGKEAVIKAFHILNTVDIPRGTSSDYTVWSVVKDLKSKSLYFRVYKDLTICVLHMADAKKGQKLKMKMSECIGGFVDITDKLTLAMVRDEL